MRREPGNRRGRTKGLWATFYDRPRPQPLEPLRDALPLTDLWVLRPAGHAEGGVTTDLQGLIALLLAGGAIVWPKARIGERRGWVARLAPCELRQDATLVALRDAVPRSHALHVEAGVKREVVAVAVPREDAEQWPFPAVTSAREVAELARTLRKLGWRR